MDYVDLYLIHWPNSSIPLYETFEALTRLVLQGKVRHLGVSNFGLQDLKEAVKLCETHIVTNQVPYGIDSRSCEVNGVLDFCRANGILITAYSPIKNSDLETEIVKEIAKHYGVTPAQLAVAWVIAKDSIITIPKSANPAHLQENIIAADIRLDPDDVKKLSNQK